MKVYILMEYDTEFSEIINVFDSLEKAQSYRGGKPEDWTSISKVWWERTLVHTALGISIPIHLSIGEWEVQ